jgi:hypothetical protein
MPHYIIQLVLVLPYEIHRAGAYGLSGPMWPFGAVKFDQRVAQPTAQKRTVGHDAGGQADAANPAY